jgi:hypothetical protein
MKNFETYFKLLSYSVVICGLVILFISGGIGIFLTSLFFTLTIFAWFLEDTKWQISERMSIVAICLIIPLYLLDWKFHLFGSLSGDNLTIGALSRLIITLALVKLFQKKSDRDWVYLYIISFFEILLAAGQSISPLFLVVLVFYLLFQICTIIAFEIRKTSNKVHSAQLLSNSQNTKNFKIKGLSLTGFSILALIVVFAIPLFFMLPRVGGAGMGQSLGGNATYSGFSDSVSLGTIGQLKQSSQVVMRVEIDSQNSLSGFKWRGISLDQFDNKRWIKTQKEYTSQFNKTNEETFEKKKSQPNTHLIRQQVILEPLDSNVLFGLSDVLSVRGKLNYVNEDTEGSLSSGRTNLERTSYVVFSDLNPPKVDELKNDNSTVSKDFYRYLQLPQNLDSRFVKLSREIIQDAKAQNNYNKAKAIESYLQTKLSYSLEMKAGGDDPLADFLFNVKAGHCEYFASSMAIMLRTQGIPTRIVNGFQSGEYNETVGMWIVRQSDAHSWVEVYFPEKKVWATFDPTPASSEISSASGSFFKKYSEALETFWIQYVVAYDNQEQAFLLRAFRQTYNDLQNNSSIWFHNFEVRLIEWWKEVRGDKGLQESAIAIAWAVSYILALALGIILIVWLFKKIIRLSIWQRIWQRFKFEDKTKIIEFYRKMIVILEKKGFNRQFHQTPLEFAYSVDIPEVVKITEKYHQVRYGEQDLTKDEAREINDWLSKLAES